MAVVPLEGTTGKHHIIYIHTHIHSTRALERAKELENKALAACVWAGALAIYGNICVSIYNT